MLGPPGLAAQADSCCRAPSRSTKRTRRPQRRNAQGFLSVLCELCVQTSPQYVVSGFSRTARGAELPPTIPRAEAQRPLPPTSPLP